jgi:hypothetical protein
VKPTVVFAIALIVCVYFAPRCEGQNRPNGSANETTNKAGQPSPFSNQINEQQIKSETQTAQAEPRHWYESPEWVLVIVGCITFIVIGWQSFETRRAATAAKLSADAFINSERGWVFLDDLPGIDLQPQQPGTAGVYALPITFKNAGKTVCRIRELSTRLHTVQAISDLPPLPQYSSTSSGIDYLLAPGEMRMGIEVLCEEALSDDVIRELRTRRRYLCFYVRVKYLDAADKERLFQQCYILYCPYGVTLAGEKEEFRIGGPRAYNNSA